MIVTEEEAKKKWCPMVRCGYSETRCIASDCMMWNPLTPKEMEIVRAFEPGQPDMGSCGFCSGAKL